MRKTTIAALVFLSTLLAQLYWIATGIGYAGDDSVVIKAQIGFDGRYKLGNWTPIVVDIENKGGDVQGDIEVEVRQPDRTSVVVFSAPAVVPSGTRKRFKLYAQINALQRDFVVKLTHKGKVLASAKVDDVVPVIPDSYLLGLVTDDREALSYWKASLGSNRIFYQYEAVYLDVDDFPDRKEVLDNFMILIINNADTAKFSRQQVEALRQWIEAGGILILGTGASGYKTLAGLKDSIISFSTLGTEQVTKVPSLEIAGESTLQGNVPFEVMYLAIDGAQPVLEHEDKGIVWKIDCGKGYIFVAAFDIGLEPFISWTGNKMLWENILNAHMSADKVSILKNIDVRRASGAWSASVKNDRIREALGAGMKSMDLPSFTKLLLILVAYLIVVGPVNYLILKKLDRREWAWFTIPLTVALFTAIIYGLGYMAKGDDIIVHAISVINLDEGSDADVESHVGVFVPKKGDYRVTVGDELLLTLGGQGIYYDYNMTPGSSQTDPPAGPVEARVVQGKHPSITFYNTSVWTMRDFMMVYPEDDLGGIEAQLYFEEDRIKGVIKNGMRYPLEDVIVYTYYGYQILGNFAAGETKQVDVPVFARTAQWQMPVPYLYSMLDQIFPYPQAVPGAYRGFDDEMREKYVRRLVVEGLMMAYDYSVTLPLKGTLNLIGFSSQKIVPDIEVNGATPQTMYHRNLVTAQFDVAYEKDGIIYIPPGVVTAVLDRGKSQGISYVEGNTVGYLNEGTGAFYFDMTPYTNVEYSKVEIYVNHQGVTPELYVYDAEKAEYVEAGEGLSIDNVQGYISIDGRAVNKYITPQGRLELKVKAFINSAGSAFPARPEMPAIIQLPTLSIEGRRR